MEKCGCYRKNVVFLGSIPENMIFTEENPEGDYFFVDINFEEKGSQHLLNIIGNILSGKKLFFRVESEVDIKRIYSRFISITEEYGHPHMEYNIAITSSMTRAEFFRIVKNYLEICESEDQYIGWGAKFQKVALIVRYPKSSRIKQ